MKYHLKRAMWNDYWLSMGLIVPATFVVVGIWTLASGELEFGESVYLWGLSALFVLLLVLRIRMIDRMFEENRRTEATITKKSLSYRGTGRIHFLYSVDGREYKGRTAIRRTNYTKALQTGDAVTVLIDSRNFKKAIIKSMYE
jgi:hypothetical protein